MQHYEKDVSTKQTPQTEAVLGREAEMTQMRSGGYGFAVDRWVCLDRFLLLGSEGGSYYASQRTLTRENAEATLACIKEDGLRVVNRIVEVSDSGRAPKNDPALFALALCAKQGDDSTKAAAYKALPKVARIFTHLSHFLTYAKAFGGLGGNGLKRALRRWYTEMDAKRLALQAVKYQQRDGWSHRDALRLAHAPYPQDERNAIFRYIVKGVENGLPSLTDTPEALRIIAAFEHAKDCGPGDVQRMVKLISDYRLPHECVPNEFKQVPDIWAAMLPSMGLTALMRNLNKMTQVGLLTGTSQATRDVIVRVSDPRNLHRARIHPINVLVALRTYAAGRGVRGSMTWDPVAQIVDALDAAFYTAFEFVEPTGLAYCLGLDVSGSMGSPASGTVLTCREAAAAMAMSVAKTEQRYETLGFTCGGDNVYGAARSSGFGHWGGGRDGVSRLSISPRERLDDIINRVAALPFGGTDVALPILWALQEKHPFDVFVNFTDNESWAGDIHVHQALRMYREQVNPKAKLVCVAFAANNYSVADPKDAGQMDCVGFDAALPNVIRDFVLR
jgi:60 kDa SS-A/Ro ribonucleoprotein